MDKVIFEKTLKEYVQESPSNFLQKEVALKPELAGMRFYDEPLIGYAAAEDPIFLEFKKSGIIGAHFITPVEWLPEAKTVISVFLPFSEQVRVSNRQDLSWPSCELLHARIEGQVFQNILCRFLEELFRKEDFAVLSPMVNSLFKTGNPLCTEKADQNFYSSNWSERHVAYAAGLGTFGLSKGLITRKGVAGRFISIITSCFFEPDKRSYKGIYDYCSNCGSCVRNCPVRAISPEKGKNHPICSAFLDKTKEKHSPRYGCAKCQVKVPCEFMMP